LAYENSDKENLKHTAHKMLPMFRQLYINEIVDKLAKIEREIDSLSTEQLLIEIQFIDERTPIIFQEIKKLFDSKNHSKKPFPLSSSLPPTLLPPPLPALTPPPT